MQEPDLANREFGDYSVLRRIGSGAMADVYLAEQRSLGRRVALKILKSELALDESYVKRFVREARAVAKLSHPNLVQIYQADYLDGLWFIAQEYVQGQTLQELIRRGGSLPAEKLAEILWCCASALDRAAQADIVHRDIKPDNILLGDDGDVKIADFGLARFSDPTEATNLALTQAGMTLGTPLYMSPEQAQGKTLDHRSDMYSLGITAYHALTGHPPFRGETALAVAIQHVNKPPEALERLRPDVPAALARIVHRMIEKPPEKRFKCFYDLQRELRLLFSKSFHSENIAGRLPDWNAFHLDKTDTNLLASTEKLHDLMQTENQLYRRRPFIGRLLVVIGVLLLGGTLGFWQTYTAANLLRPLPGGGIVKRATVAEQWVYACELKSADGWNSVIDEFPDEEFWVRKAKRQLIRLYLQSGDTYGPLPIFLEFSDLSGADADDRALGLAGLAWCAAENRDDPNDAIRFLLQVVDLNPTYSDSLLLQLMDAANKRIQQSKKSP